MKLTTGVIAITILTGAAWAQNPGIIERTKNALLGVHPQQTAASKAAPQGTTSPAKPSGAVPGKPAAAQSAPAAKPATPAAQPAPAVKPVSAKPAAPAPQAATVKPVSTKPATPAAPQAAQPAKPAVSSAKTQAAPKVPVVVKPAAAPKPAAKGKAEAPKIAAKAASATAAPKADANASGESAPKAEKQEDKKYAMTGKRDPFVSPVVNRATGSGCSTGKKCLDIEQIALHGVVKSDNGMIAVVTNGLNKAYFLRENDPVFNGYVVKITGDSIVFKQNFQDRLGKPFTKDVVKRITTPAV